MRVSFAPARLGGSEGGSGGALLPRAGRPARARAATLTQRARLDAVPEVREEQPFDHRVRGALAAREHHHGGDVVQPLEVVHAARVGAHDAVDEALEGADLRGRGEAEGRRVKRGA